MTTVGHIYVRTPIGIKAYEVAGGPPPGRGAPDRAGGHVAEATPAGRYILGPTEHHTTMNWPYSVVPWGAKIREQHGLIEYQRGSEWVTATGRFGTVTRAMILWDTRSGRPTSIFKADQDARRIFTDDHGDLLTEWKKNDFGKWSWNLVRDGHRTPIYIHTRPDDEADTDAGRPFDLIGSHGCLHIRPRDRNEMMSRGYLKAGVAVEVFPYGRVGPPR